jgi:predicted dehydrogenase
MIDAAIVGLGRWGKGIVEAMQGKSRRLRFVRGICKEPEQLAGFAKSHGFELSTEFSDALNDPRVQAVFIVTPHSLHVDQIVAVAAAGKAIWCEKPLALTRAEAERAIAAVKKAGVPFGLGNSKRCYASMRELKRVVASGATGDVLHIEGHFSNEHSTRVIGGWRDDPGQSPGAGMTGGGIHILDAFVNLAGPIATVDAKVFARKGSPDPRDVAAALVQFRSGATGLLATVRAAPTYWRVHVFGTHGSAEARDETTLNVALMGEKPQTTTYPQVDSLAALLEAFAESVETGKPFPGPIADMLDVVSAFEALIRSTEEGGPVKVGN